MKNWALVVLIALAGCADDQDDKLPVCTDLGAPTGAPLFCTQAGVCAWDGAECCAAQSTDPRCQAD